MDATEPQTFAAWMIFKLQWLAPPFFGSIVSILVGKDWHPKRVVAGVASGLFMAYYFTDLVVYYLPMPPDTPTERASAMAGALIGLSGYVVVSRIIEMVQTGDIKVLGGLIGISNKGEKQ